MANIYQIPGAKVWARLRLPGARSSLRRVLRLMREHALWVFPRIGPAGQEHHAGHVIMMAPWFIQMPWADAVDVMWGTDMTATWTSEGQAAVFMASDHHRAATPGSLFVGSHAACHGNMLCVLGFVFWASGPGLRILGFGALEPIRD
jgi:hypothetical protein